MTEATHTEEKPLTQEEKDAANAEKFRAQQLPPDDESIIDNGSDADDDKPQRPEHIPEKFWDAEKGEVRVEDLAKSYAELEKAKSEAPKPEGEENKAGANANAGDDDVAKTISAHREAITAKLVAGEALAEADYAPFEKVGFGRADVDAFIAGQQALGQLIQMEMHNEVGGADTYKAMTEWAKTNLKPEEIAAFNRDVVASDDRAVNLNAVRGLYARYQLANGRDSRDVTLNAGGRATGASYASGAEMRADMASERYKKDAGFRASVAAKVAASRQAGVDLSL